MMRYLTIILFAFSIQSSAQTASDFSIDDVDGTTRNLFTELDNNQIVVLKFFTNWCTICNNTADEVVTIYNGYQTNGDPVVFWALDRDQNETNADAITYRTNNSIPFPVIGEAYSIAQQFGVVYQPEYYIIRPDRSYVKKTNYTTMNTAVDDALSSLTTGIEENVSAGNLIITENAVTWIATSSGRAELSVFDSSGRMVVNQKVDSEEKVALNLAGGVYIYRLVDPKGIYTVGKIGIAN